MIKVENKENAQSEVFNKIMTLLNEDLLNREFTKNKIYLLAYDIKADELTISHQDVENMVFISKFVNMDAKTLEEIKTNLLERFLEASSDLKFPLNMNLTTKFFGSPTQQELTQGTYKLEYLLQLAEEGVNLSYIGKTYFNYYQMNEIAQGQSEGLDVSIYAKKKFSHYQMRRIRLGLNQGLDVTKYADTKYNHDQMRELSMGQRSGVNIDLYADPKYDYYEMRDIRRRLEKNQKQTSFLLNIKDKLSMLFKGKK